MKEANIRRIPQYDSVQFCPTTITANNNKDILHMIYFKITVPVQTATMLSAAPRPEEGHDGTVSREQQTKNSSPTGFHSQRAIRKEVKMERSTNVANVCSHGEANFSTRRKKKKKSMQLRWWHSPNLFTSSNQWHPLYRNDPLLLRAISQFK